MKPVIAGAVLVLSALAGGCGSDPASPTSPTRSSPVTETFTSNLVVQGSAWRIVTASQAGTLTATLTTTNQPSTVVGVAVGLRNGNGTGCLLNSSVTAEAGSAPQLSARVDAGDYCVKVFDAGSLSTPMSFTVTIVYP